MKKIKNIKVSLMETDDNKKNKEKNKKNFIIRYSAILDIDKIIPYSKDQNYVDYVLESVSIIYNTLLEQYKDSKYNCDSVGLWITFENETLDNSISLSLLDDMNKYSLDNDIDPIKEFFKMTLNL